MRKYFAAGMAATAALVATSAPAALIGATTSGGQVIGAVIAGTSYTVSATGTVDLCGSCNAGGPLVFRPDGTVATTAQAPYGAFNSGPKDYDPAGGTSSYGFYGAGINFGELYGSFSATPTASSLFAIGFGTTFTASTSGTLYGVINDSAYGDNPGTPQYSVTLAPTVVSGAVPEPASWAFDDHGLRCDRHDVAPAERGCELHLTSGSSSRPPSISRSTARSRSLVQIAGSSTNVNTQRTMGVLRSTCE